jgi:hypothetical protein
MMISLALAIGAFLAAEIVLSKRRASDLGSVSAHWIAEQRRSEYRPKYLPGRRA